MDTQGRRIKKLRLAKGLSQKRLSDMVGIVPTHLQAYEYGTRHPKEEILNRLAKALDVTPSMLQPLDVDTVNGLLGIIYEMHTSYHGLEIVEEDGQISIRLPNTLQAMPAKNHCLGSRKFLTIIHTSLIQNTSQRKTSKKKIKFYRIRALLLRRRNAGSKSKKVCCCEQQIYIAQM